MTQNPDRVTTTSSHQRTLLALQRHPALQVVHLQLEALQRPVGVTSLPLVGDQHGDDRYEQHATTCSDTDDRRQRQGAVGVDMERTWGVLQTANQDLQKERDSYTNRAALELNAPGTERPRILYNFISEPNQRVYF